MGQAWATAEGHCCSTRWRSSRPNRQIAQGSMGGCGEVAVAAAAAACELDCERFSVDVEDFELSKIIKKKKNH